MFDSLAWAAWNSESTAQTWFSDLVQSSGVSGRFQTLANAYLGTRFYQLNTLERHALRYSDSTLYPLAHGGTPNQQQAIDAEIAARLARRHNGGAWWLPVSVMKTNDAHNYVKKIFGDPGFGNDGNYLALRCAGGLSKPGLTITPLQIP
jgi:hypothetical protein